MRKAFGIVIGCTLLCGLVMAAMLAVPPPTNIEIKINLDYQTDGVDQPWFVLSKGARDTVQWKNETAVPCTVSFGQDTPFDVEPIRIPSGEVRGPYEATKAPPPPPTERVPRNEVYKVYKYSVKCGGATFDPGGGMKP
jgi:hypothetical protein